MALGGTWTPGEADGPDWRRYSCGASYAHVLPPASEVQKQAEQTPFAALQLFSSEDGDTAGMVGNLPSLFGLLFPHFVRRAARRTPRRRQRRRAARVSSLLLVLRCTCRTAAFPLSTPSSLIQLGGTGATAMSQTAPLRHSHCLDPVSSLLAPHRTSGYDHRVAFRFRLSTFCDSLDPRICSLSGLRDRRYRPSVPQVTGRVQMQMPAAVG